MVFAYLILVFLIFAEDCIQMSAVKRQSPFVGLRSAPSPGWGSPQPTAVAKALWPVEVPTVILNVMSRLSERGAPLAGLADVKKLQLLDSAEIDKLLQLVKSGHAAIVQAYRATLLDRSAHALALRLAALVQVSPTVHAIGPSFSPAPAYPRSLATAETPPSFAAYHSAFLPGTPPPPPGIATPYSSARSVVTPSHPAFHAPPLPASPASRTPQAQQLVAVSPPSGQSTATADATQDMWNFINRLHQRGDVSARVVQLCRPLLIQGAPRAAAAWQQLVQSVATAEAAMLTQLEASPRSAWGDAQQLRAMRRLQEHKSAAENTFLWAIADMLVAEQGERILSEFSHKALGLESPYGAPPLQTAQGGALRMPVPTPLGSPDSAASQDEDWVGGASRRSHGGGHAPPAASAPTSTHASSKSSTSDSAWLGQVNTPPYMQNGTFVSPSSSGGAGVAMPPPADAAARMQHASEEFPHTALAGVYQNIAAMGMLPPSHLRLLSDLIRRRDARLAAVYLAWEDREGEEDGELMPLLHEVCSLVEHSAHAPSAQHLDGMVSSTADAPMGVQQSPAFAGRGGSYQAHPKSWGAQAAQAGAAQRGSSVASDDFEVVETLSGGEMEEGESNVPPPHPDSFAHDMGADFVDTSYTSLSQNDGADQNGGGSSTHAGGLEDEFGLDMAKLGKQHAELVGQLRSTGRISGSDATALRHMWADGEPRVRAAWVVAAHTGDASDLTQTLLTILEQEIASASATPEHVLHVVNGMADLKRISARQAEVLRSIVHLAGRGDSLPSESGGGDAPQQGGSSGGGSSSMPQRNNSNGSSGSGAFPFASRGRTSSFYVHTSEAQEALHTITQALAGGSRGAAGEGTDSLQGVLTAVAEDWMAATSASTPRSTNSGGGSGPKGSRAGTDLSEASTGTATRNVDTIPEASHADKDGIAGSQREPLNVDTSPKPEGGAGGYHSAAAHRGFSQESDMPWVEEDSEGGGDTPEALRSLEACAAGEGDPRAGSREWVLIRVARLVKSGELNDAQASVLAQLANGNDARLWGALEAYKALCAPEAADGDGPSASQGGAGGMCSPDGDLDDTLVRLAVITLKQQEAPNTAA